MQRTTAIPSAYKGIHVGVIMDGNGRWAAARGLPRTSGHRAGVRAARQVVESATQAGVGTLTLYAFSADNWTRPTPEVRALMRLLGRSLIMEGKHCFANGVRLTVVGRRDRLPASLLRAIHEAETLTLHGRNLHLRVAIDYSARESIMRAATIAGAEPMNRERFARLLAEVNHDPFPIRDVDLLIRSGGEKRLSDFLLWECAYAEFHFARCMWPDFSEAEFRVALGEFEQRERRFGGVPAQAAS